MPVPIDPCPTCGGQVTAVRQVGSTPATSVAFTLPCHHDVVVTVQPDRFELARRPVSGEPANR